MSKGKVSKKHRKWKARVGAGCLALGMATAWGGEAKASVYLNVSATPDTTINNAFVYFGNNASTALIFSLGTLPAGQTTSWSYQVLDGTVADFQSDPANYDEVNGHRPPYAVIGLYDEGVSPGVAISFPNDDPLTIPLQWADIFETTGHSFWDYSEAEVVDLVNQAVAGDKGELDSFLYVYSDSHYGLFDPPPCGTELGEQATLVCFSDPTPGGRITFDVAREPINQAVPEPASWVIFVGMAGALLFWRRDLLGR